MMEIIHSKLEHFFALVYRFSENLAFGGHFGARGENKCVAIEHDGLKMDKMENYQPQLIDAFLTTKNQTILRNLLVAIIHQPLIEYREGELYDNLIKHILNFDNKVALQVNCIYKLMQFIQKYPDLKPEIQESVELLSEQNQQASLKSAVKKLNKSL